MLRYRYMQTWLSKNDNDGKSGPASGNCPCFGSGHWTGYAGWRSCIGVKRRKQIQRQGPGPIKAESFLYCEVRTKKRRSKNAAAFVIL
jgi:hypothetical protein